jgi:hypothetical protein
MAGHHTTRLVILAALLLACASNPALAQHKHDKTVWNYDGGFLLSTDGIFPQGPCFRINGKMDHPDFFNNLRREDTNSGTLFRRGNEIVTEFPAQMRLILQLYDLPCDGTLQHAATRVYLNRALLSTLRITFFWKRGMAQRPAPGISLTNVDAERVLPYATEHAAELPEKYEWYLDFAIPSGGVPVTDSLVIIFRDPKNQMIARVAARM